MKLLHLYLQGFKSFVEPQHFKLSENGVYFITGSNGSGKSTLVEAIHWCLYGYSIKTGTSVESKHPDYEKTEVTVLFEKSGHSYKVVRGKNPSVLEIYVDEKPVDLKGIPARKKYLQEILGVSSPVFLNSVVFAQRSLRLAEIQDADRRGIFESLFDTEFIEVARKEARRRAKDFSDEVDDLKKEYQDIRNLIARMEGEYDAGRRHLQNFQKSKDEALNDLRNDVVLSEKVIATTEQKIVELNLKIDQAQDQIDKIEKQIAEEEDAFKSAKQKAQDAAHEVFKIRNELKSVKDEMLNLEFTCSKCGTELDADKVNQMSMDLNAKQQELTSALYDAENTHSLLKNMVDASEERLGVLICNRDEFNEVRRSRLSTKGECARKVEMFTETIRRTKTKIAAKERETPSIDLLSLEKKIEEAQIDLADKQSEVHHVERQLEIVEWWAKVGFGSTGLKGYIFNYLLSKLNARLISYAARIGLKIKYSIDLDSAAKKFKIQCWKGGIPINYSELSGGEKTRIDIATAFAMNDLLPEPMNILVLDEALINLDAKGMEEIVDIMKEKSKTAAIYVITHVVADFSWAREIKIVKKNNASQIEKTY